MSGGETGPLGTEPAGATETGTGRVLFTPEEAGGAEAVKDGSFRSAFGVVAVELGAESSLSEMVALTVETSSTCSTSAPPKLLALVDRVPLTAFGAAGSSSSPVKVSVSLSLEASTTAVG